MKGQIIIKNNKIYYNEYLKDSANTKVIKHYKAFLRYAIMHVLSEKESRRFCMHYFEGKSKTAIARSESIGCSAVCKSLKKSLGKIELYMNAFMAVCSKVQEDEDVQRFT